MTNRTRLGFSLLRLLAIEPRSLRFHHTFIHSRLDLTSECGSRHHSLLKRGFESHSKHFCPMGMQNECFPTLIRSQARYPLRHGAWDGTNTRWLPWDSNPRLQMKQLLGHHGAMQSMTIRLHSDIKLLLTKQAPE